MLVATPSRVNGHFVNGLLRTEGAAPDSPDGPTPARPLGPVATALTPNLISTTARCTMVSSPHWVTAPCRPERSVMGAGSFRADAQSARANSEALSCRSLHVCLQRQHWNT